MDEWLWKDVGMGWGRGWCGKVEFGQKVGSLGMEGCGKVGNRVLDEFLNMERVVFGQGR